MSADEEAKAPSEPRASPSPPAAAGGGGGASVVDKILRRKNKASAPKEAKEPKEKAKGKEKKKKRSRGKGGDDQEERGRFSRFEAVASEVRERARMWMLARAAGGGGWLVVGWRGCLSVILLGASVKLIVI